MFVFNKNGLYNKSSGRSVIDVLRCSTQKTAMADLVSNSSHTQKYKSHRIGAHTGNLVDINLKVMIA